MKYVGIITAVEEELEAVQNIMEGEIEMEYQSGLHVTLGQINGVNCILARSGAGKVNAARTAQILIDKYDIEYVINVGVAGSLNQKLEIGDVVIAETAVQHDFDITAFDHSKGYIPEVGNEVECDISLVEKFTQAIDNLEERNYKVVKGIVATGDIFCTEVAMKEKIASKFKADCVEMEGAAIGQVCKLSEVPFIIIRSISDSPNGSNELDYNEYVNLASKRCANMLKEYFLLFK